MKTKKEIVELNLARGSNSAYLFEENEMVINANKAIQIALEALEQKDQQMKEMIESVPTDKNRYLIPEDLRTWTNHTGTMSKYNGFVDKIDKWKQEQLNNLK